jgi:uncharacterized protein (TIGR02145 family)
MRYLLTSLLCVFTLSLTAQEAGCTYSIANNYSSTATVDDGTCVFGSGLCGEGTMWNSELELCEITNPTDSNFDGCTGLNDLLNLLSMFGECTESNSCGNPVNYQGYDYSTVQIGEQCWFAENCRYLPAVVPSSVSSNILPFSYVYGYEGYAVAAAKATANYETYGVLYNRPAVMVEGICPSGWHIPSDGEWQTMVISLGMSEADAASEGWRGSPVGDYMKSTSGWGWSDWSGSSGNGSNSSGFTGLPGGLIDPLDGFFFWVEELGYWWTASGSDTSAWVWGMWDGWDDVSRNVSTSLSAGYSARCVRD